MGRDDPKKELVEADQRRDELLRRALATPPISNEEILRRSSQRRVQRMRGSPKSRGASK